VVLGCDAPCMGVSVAFDRASIEVQPGQQASRDVQVRNTGSVVDRVLLDVLGEAREWMTVEPAEISLMPAARGHAAGR
jgi:hypothetical protein